MHSRLVFRLALYLSVLVSASDLDIIWPSSGDSLFSDTGLPMDQTSSSLIETNKLPEDPESSSFGGLDLSLSTPSAWDDVASNDSFNLADCPSSEQLPVIGKSRMRRLDEPGSCKIPTGVDTFPEDPSEEAAIDSRLLGDSMRNSPGFAWVTDAVEKQDHHLYCSVYSSNFLPWGVCSSGLSKDEIPFLQKLLVPLRGEFDFWQLYRFTLGVF